MADECVRQMDGMKLENLAITVEIARRCVESAACAACDKGLVLLVFCASLPLRRTAC